MTNVIMLEMNFNDFLWKVMTNWAEMLQVSVHT